MTGAILPHSLQILVVEDHALYVEGLKMAFATADFDVDLVAKGSVEHAQAWLLQNSPHLVLLDLNLPDGSGWDLLQWISHLSTPIPCAMLTGSDMQTDMDKALQMGARGFINKGIDSAELVAAVRTIINGDIYTPCADSMTLSGRERALASGITPRQYEVLALLAQGLPNKIICQELGLTADTVKTHLKALFSHFGVHNRTECVAVAAKQRLVEVGAGH